LGKEGRHIDAKGFLQVGDDQFAGIGLKVTVGGGNALDF
jgi:hypothetical protein